MPRAPGFAGDKLGGIIGAAHALKREADEKEQDAAALYAKIDGAIRKIGGKHGGNVGPYCNADTSTVKRGRV